MRRGALWLDPRTVEQDQWSSLVGLVGLGDLTAPRTRTIRKALARRYDKGVVTRSGRVLPFTLADW